MNTTAKALAAIILFVSARGASPQPTPASAATTARVGHIIDCVNHPQPDLTPVSFTDEDNGIEFSYPAVLFPDGTGGFTDSSCGRQLRNFEFIRYAVTMAAHEPLPFAHPGAGDIVVTESLGGHLWSVLTRPGEMHACTYAGEEQVCFMATGPPTDQISAGAAQVIQQMMSSLVFHPSERLDAQIAGLKIGQQFGPLTVSRVITRQMFAQDPKRYARAGYDMDDTFYGEVDFTGALTWHGEFDQTGTMNSGPFYDFSPNFDDSSEWPFPLGRQLLGRVYFTNSRPIYAQMNKARRRPGDPADWDGPDWTLIVKNIRVLFSPGSSYSTIHVDLVRLTRDSPPHQP